MRFQILRYSSLCAPPVLPPQVTVIKTPHMSASCFQGESCSHTLHYERAAKPSNRSPGHNWDALAQVTWNSSSQSLKYTLCRVTSPHRPEAVTGIRGADEAHLTAHGFVCSWNKWLHSATCQLGRKHQFGITGNGNPPSSAPHHAPRFSLLATDQASGQ